jgi:ribonuclease P/MRP protein subunit RPP1
LLIARSLVLKALRKKHFYKETIRVDRLLPNEQLTSTKFKLVDWIAVSSVSSEGVLNQLEPSSNFDERPGSPIRGVMEGSQEEPHDSDASVFAKLSEQSGDHEQIPSQTQEETLQVDRTEVLIDCGQSILTASLCHQNAVLAKARDSEVVPDPFMQAGPGSSVNPKCIVNHVEFVQHAMDVDATELHGINLTVGDDIPSTSGTSAKLLCSSLPHAVELSGTSLEDQGTCQSREILANDKSYAKYHTDCGGGEREKTLVDHEIPSNSVVCPEDLDFDQSTGMQVDAETCRDTSELVEWPPSRVDDEAPLDLAFCSSHKLLSNVIIQREIMEGKIEQSMDENIELTVENETEFIDKKTRTSVSMEPAFHGQKIGLASYKRSTDASCESNELKEQHSEETIASLEKTVAKTHELLPKFSYPSGKVEMSTVRSGKI